MITVIHGDDLSSSRAYYLNEKHKHKEPVEFLEDKISVTDLLQVSTGSSLFNLEKAIFIENLLSNKKSAGLKDVIDYVKVNYKNHNFYLWEDTVLSKATLSQFPNPLVKLFKIPQNLFSFLDNIAPDNEKNVYFFHRALENSNQELILFMIIKQFRLMLGVLSNASIDEVKKIAYWRRDKLKKQAELFGEEKLIESIKKLHKMDKELKSGQTGLNTVQSIDFFLLSI